jgi:uroporphyrinogen-III synthase
MRLLVTRPEPDASETAARLKGMGHEVIVQPMLAVVFEPPPAELAPGSLVFTSRNAVRALLAWPDAAGWRRLPAFAVGAETAALLRDAGFRDVRVAGGDAEALIGLVAAEMPAALGTLLYPAPRDQAADLAGRLSAQGFRVARVEAYRTEPASRLDEEVVAALRGNRIDGALFFSERTATAFARLAAEAGLTDALRRVTCFALSPRTAAPLAGMTGDMRIAPRPDAASLLALVPAPVKPR